MDPKAPDDDARFFPMRDRLLILFVALELIAFPLLPAAPLAIAGAALTTPLRHYRGRMRALWVLAALLTAIVAAPFVIGLFDFSFVEEGPVHVG